MINSSYPFMPLHATTSICDLHYSVWVCLCIPHAMRTKTVKMPACLAQVYEKGNFAGLDEMKRSERLFNRVAAMGVANIVMAVQYAHVQRPPLRGTPIWALEGLADATIDPAAMAQWAGYTSGRFRLVPLMGDHYFVSSRFREVRTTGPAHHPAEVIPSSAAYGNEHVPSTPPR